MPPATDISGSPPAEWPLWPDQPPGAPAEPDRDEVPVPPASADPGTYERVGRPSLFVYPSERPSGAAALMFPGGGYQHVAIGKGSGDIARMLNAVGVSVFMLKYRLPLGRWAAGPDTVLQDGQRAMRLIRAAAKRLAIDPANIAALGFSAGALGPPLWRRAIRRKPTMPSTTRIGRARGPTSQDYSFP